MPSWSARRGASASSVSFFLLPIRQLSLSLQLNVFPGIGVSGRHSREDVLPLRGGNPRPDRLHCRVPEHWDEIVIVENLALDFLGQFLPLGAIDRGEVAGEVRVEVGDTIAVFAVEAAAAHRSEE